MEAVGAVDEMEESSGTGEPSPEPQQQEEAEPQQAQLDESSEQQKHQQLPTSAEGEAQPPSEGAEMGCSKEAEEGEGEQASQANHSSQKRELVDFKVVYNKRKFDVSFPQDETVEKLKEHLQGVIGVPPAMQKVMVKGLARDERTLRELGVSSGTKLLVVGSTINDVMAVNSASAKDLADEALAGAAAAKEPLSQQKMHRKILERGVPEDAMPGIKNLKDGLPAYPLTGMLNKGGGKVRLTFKLEQDQLWIGTKERTDKLPMSSIKNVVSEPIQGNEEYHIMGIQLGPTEASRYWVYWVPAQFVDAIKDAILGKWQYF